jgi:hypothetical protein
LAADMEVIQVAVEAFKKVIVHAKGSPARIVAVGVAAGLAALAVGIGYGAYKGGEKVTGFFAAR